MSLGVYQIYRSKTYKGGEEINGSTLLQGSYTCNSIPFQYLSTFGGRLGYVKMYTIKSVAIDGSEDAENLKTYIIVVGR